MTRSLVPVQEHLDRILGQVQPLAPLDQLLGDAHGCVLAEDVVARTDLPAFDNSSMDGYAVRLADLAGATDEHPARLRVVGDIPAGTEATYRIAPGAAARIMTGAPVPTGAEAVAPVEWTDGGVVTVSVRRPPQPGQYIRRRGEDVVAGEVVLRAGTRLGAAQIGLLAAVGRARVPVRPRPRVVVISTGSELVEPGAKVGPGQISDSNSYQLTACAWEAGAIGYNVGIVPDEPRRVLETVEDQLIRADLIVTSGGVSAGAYDVVKDVLSRLGSVRFDRVAMQPGMPQGFGTIGPDATPIFTLPGNPVSSYVSFEIFVRPALRRMRGIASAHRPVVQAVCGEAFSSPPGKRQYARAWLEEGADGYVVRPVGGAGSHLLAGLAHANALIVVGEETTAVPAGSTVTVMVLERRGT